jgi:hypothetical protein
MNVTSIGFETANPTRVSICAARLAIFEDETLTEAAYGLIRPPKPNSHRLCRIAQERYQPETRIAATMISDATR